jgi:hypothetical protein
MRCNKVKLIFDDYLSKTLSAEEMREIDSHLESCESCRIEFRELKNADDLLRETVCEMVAGIEVPPDLSGRIEKVILTGEQTRKGITSGRIAAFLKKPAVAAAVFLALTAAGAWGYFNDYFNTEMGKPKVALTESQEVPVGKEDVFSGNVVQDAAPRSAGTGQAPGEDVKEFNKGEVAGEEKNAGRAPDREAGVQTLTQPLKEPVPEESVDLQQEIDTEEVARLAPKGLGELQSTGIEVLKKGTMEEAARELGFKPARPAYLPQGAVLTEVFWDAGAVYQNYRVGELHFTVSQSRAEGAELKYEAMMRQGLPIEINGFQAVLQESGPEPGDNISPANVSVCWQQGDWFFSVTGGLPVPEIKKIALSLN